ncbi:hypothetical protein N018_05665 [Pseudomonas syringae CC1557]|uniref:Uncharacterized protein n=1 Tax=Pseudomonas syringae CC1557 TaxID=1357279 RepID=W0N2K6_PSESX|nr:hypothetical protein N018_05665 [Pseudomonas syringae CC1557]
MFSLQFSCFWLREVLISKLLDNRFCQTRDETLFADNGLLSVQRCAWRRVERSNDRSVRGGWSRNEQAWYGVDMG